MMKKWIVLVVALAAVLTAWAQDETKRLTFFNEFKPATVLMKDGKVLKVALANVFLKDASLLYMKGTNIMSANMQNVKSVQLNNLFFENINNKLALFVDSVGDNRLYCITELDIEAYKTILKNNVNITTNSFEELLGNSDQLSYTTVEIGRPEDQQFPVMRQFYYRYGGKMVRVHEREVSRRVPKAKKHMYQSILALPDFSWTKVESLMQMLKAISE